MSSIKISCDLLRKDCGRLEERIRRLKHDIIFEQPETKLGQHEEIEDNIKLAYRHLESVRMRLGKVCQHADDGISIFDKEK